MIVDHPSRPALDGVTLLRRWRDPVSTHPAIRNGFVLFFIAATVLTLQVLSGAYHSEFGGYPDEPAHYVTGLMVRDYVAQMKFESPMQFAEEYYAHYPKIAFGHWPPFLYVVQAAWMLVFSWSRTSVLLEMAVLTVLLGYSVYAIAREVFSFWTSFAAALVVVSLPLIQVYTDEIMAEALLVLVSFWGAVYFARYLDSGRWQDNLGFGIFSSLAILTKGNGWEMALLPPIAILLTRRYRVWLKPSFWLSAAIVIALCVPWQIMTLDMAQRGWTGGERPSVAYALDACEQFGLILWSIAGPWLGAVILLGIVVEIVAGYLRKSVSALWASLFGLLIGTWVFQMIVPAGVESRKIIAAVPALVFFLMAGGRWLASRLPATKGFRPWRGPLVSMAGCLVFAVTGFSIPRERHYGFEEAGKFIDAQPELRGTKILVSSQHDGEGLLISEIAMHETRPNHTIIRGTKALARADWNGSSYECFLKSPADVMEFLREKGIGVLAFDTLPAKVNFAHHAMILEALRQYPAKFQLLRAFAVNADNGSGQILIYRVQL